MDGMHGSIFQSYLESQQMLHNAVTEAISCLRDSTNALVSDEQHEACFEPDWNSQLFQVCSLASSDEQRASGVLSDETYTLFRLMSEQESCFRPCMEEGDLPRMKEYSKIDTLACEQIIEELWNAERKRKGSLFDIVCDFRMMRYFVQYLHPLHDHTRPLVFHCSIMLVHVIIVYCNYLM